MDTLQHCGVPPFRKTGVRIFNHHPEVLHQESSRVKKEKQEGTKHETLDRSARPAPGNPTGLLVILEKGQNKRLF